MSTAMRTHGLGVLGHAFGLRIAEEDQDRVADELVDRAAMLERDRRHLGQILVEQPRDLLRLQALGGGGEVLDVGEEDRELLALGLDRDVLLAAEDALVDLRRQIARDLHRERGEEIVGRLELAVHAADRPRLPPLQHDEVEAGPRP